MLKSETLIRNLKFNEAIKLLEKEWTLLRENSEQKNIGTVLGEFAGISGILLPLYTSVGRAEDVIKLCEEDLRYTEIVVKGTRTFGVQEYDFLHLRKVWDVFWLMG